ncbi:MAG TPA: FkbM family methyltransferase [Lacunisphaera sp.]|nr:FkbM family methyltransferase [Lacunisphaera sp.]
MHGVYHTRGFWRGLARQPAWHLREYARNPAYRALHRFHGQLRGIPRYKSAVVSFDRRPIQLCDGPSFLSAWDEIFVNRIYEIRAEPAGTPCLVDAGANIGLAALFWKWRYGRFRYIGFEPDPMVAACCRENLRAWQVDGELHEIALAGRDGHARFQPDRADGGQLLPGAAAGDASAIGVKLQRLSTFLPEAVDLLKLDIEGAEGDVLAEIAPALPRVKALFLEWHSRPGARGLGRAVDLLESAGFDCFVQVAQGPRQPFLEPGPAEGFSQQLNLYALRP